MHPCVEKHAGSMWYHRRKKTHDAHTEADGQMNLFGSFAMQNSGEEAGEQETAGSCHIPDFLGLAVACGEEEICYVEVSEALPCRKIRELFAGSAAASYATLDLKPQLKELGMLEKKRLGTISEENLFDNTIAAYLLNPIKMNIRMRTLPRIMRDLMIPSRKDLLGKLSYMIWQWMKTGRIFKDSLLYGIHCTFASKKAMMEDLKAPEWNISMKLLRCR